MLDVEKSKPPTKLSLWLPGRRKQSAWCQAKSRWQLLDIHACPRLLLQQMWILEIEILCCVTIAYPRNLVPTSNIQIIYCNIVVNCISSKDWVDFSDYTDASARKMAGNGMSLPEGGFMLLMMMLCIDPKWKYSIWYSNITMAFGATQLGCGRTWNSCDNLS